MGRLIGIAYSPWTARAKWVLGLKGVFYSWEAYRPLLDEPRLRLSLRRPMGHVSVPVYIDDTGSYDDSRLIAEHVNSLGLQWDLFPQGEFEALNTWIQRAEDFAFAGRALVVRKTEIDTASLKASIEVLAPKPVAAVFNKFPAASMQLFKTKYQTHSKGLDDWKSLLRIHLEKINEQWSGRAYLLSDLSYADIALATALQFVSPVGQSYIEIPKGVEKCWKEPAFMEEFPEIFRWRDEIFRRHWPKP